jgi:hypothetical protein
MLAGCKQILARKVEAAQEEIERLKVDHELQLNEATEALEAKVDTRRLFEWFRRHVATQGQSLALRSLQPCNLPA